jgi:hypothetical protein
MTIAVCLATLLILVSLMMVTIAFGRLRGPEPAAIGVLFGLVGLLPAGLVVRYVRGRGRPERGASLVRGTVWLMAPLAVLYLLFTLLALSSAL